MGVGTPVYPGLSVMLKRANLSIAPIAKHIAPPIMMISKKVFVLKDW